MAILFNLTNLGPINKQKEVLFLTPMITVIIPAYNAEKTIDRCLNSVFAQDFEKLEIIFINDGSKDFTLDIAKRYENNNNLVIINQPNGGVARARWAGIAASRGEWLAFLDADDYMAPDMMSKMFSKAENTAADVVVCDWVRVSKNVSYSSQLYKGLEYKNENGEDAIERIIINNNNGSLWNKIYKRKLIINENIKKTVDIRYGEDKLLLFFTLLMAAKVAYITDALYYYVQNDGSVTQSLAAEHIKEGIMVDNLIFDFLNSSKNKKHKRIASLFYAKALLNNLRLLIQFKKTKQVETLRSHIKKELSCVSLFTVDKRNIRLIFDLFLFKMRIFYFVYLFWGKNILPHVLKYRISLAKKYD